MTDHDSMAELLVHRLREAGQPAEEPITVAELHKVLLPYHRCRDALGYATKAEYDLALLHLLRDRGRVKIHEKALAEAVEEELESPEPGLGFLRNFAAVQVRLRVPVTGTGDGRSDGDGASGPASGGEAGPDRKETGPGAPESTSGPAGTGAAAAAADAGPGAAEAHPEATAGGEAEGGRSGPQDWLEAYDPGAGETEAAERSWEPGERCWECGRELPARSTLRFCPFCGTDQTMRRCAGCQEVLEPGWSYCPRCGSETGSP